MSANTGRLFLCRSTAHKNLIHYRTLPAALAAVHDRILPCGIAGAGSGQVDNLIFIESFMVSLRAGFSPFFLCLRASRSRPSATSKTASKVVGRQDGGAFS